MEKNRRTFTTDFKVNRIEMHLHRGIDSKLLRKEIEVTCSVINGTFGG
ncbi:hypothetical protein ACIQD3_18750 [Peribacillus loiseleuriae]